MTAAIVRDGAVAVLGDQPRRFVPSVGIERPTVAELRPASNAQSL